MFPHPQNLITIRAMEIEQILAEADRVRHHHGRELRFGYVRRVSLRRPGPALQNRSLLQRAARALSLLVG